MTAISAEFPSKRFQYGGIVAGTRAEYRSNQAMERRLLEPVSGLPENALTDPAFHAIVVTAPWSHRLIVRTAAALRWNPGDVAVRILDVAGFAMDAVLSVDLEPGTRRFLHPLVNAGRAIAV